MMGSRDVPFDKETVCDRCGKKGAYDFMGDCFCPDCLTTDKYGHTRVKSGKPESERGER